MKNANIVSIISVALGLLFGGQGCSTTDFFNNGVEEAHDHCLAGEYQDYQGYNCCEFEDFQQQQPELCDRTTPCGKKLGECIDINWQNKHFLNYAFCVNQFLVCQSKLDVEPTTEITEPTTTSTPPSEVSTTDETEATMQVDSSASGEGSSTEGGTETTTSSSESSSSGESSDSPVCGNALVEEGEQCDRGNCTAAQGECYQGYCTLDIKEDCNGNIPHPHEITCSEDCTDQEPTEGLN